MSLDTFASSLADAFENTTPEWAPYPWQIAPGEIGTQCAWLIEGGRGIGKTDGCAHYVNEHALSPACDPRFPGGHRIAIIAPTLDDAAESCVTGPSGLQAHNPEIRLRTMLGGSKAIWPNGAEAKLFSGKTEEDADRLRAGGNRCLVWIEEAAAIKHLGTAVKQARYGLRLGPRPHIVGSSTPKRTIDYKAFRADLTTVRTHGTTDLAHHLNQGVRDRLYADYAGTRLGRQELEGELLEDVEGALWTLATIEDCRVETAPIREFWKRTVVALDPSDGLADGDEQALAIVTADIDHGLYVLVSEGHRTTVTDYLRRAVTLAIEYDAVILMEKNHGGAYLTATLEQVMREMGVTIPHQTVDANAGNGKITRAGPVAALYEQHKVHHVGVFDHLEDQMTTFTGKAGEKSPDRLDALVWAVRHLTGMTYRDAGGHVAKYDLYADDHVAGWT